MQHATALRTMMRVNPAKKFIDSETQADSGQIDRTMQTIIDVLNAKILTLNSVIKQV